LLKQQKTNGTQHTGEGVELIINTNIATLNAYNNLMKNHN